MSSLSQRETSSNLWPKHCPVLVVRPSADSSLEHCQLLQADKCQCMHVTICKCIYTCNIHCMFNITLLLCFAATFFYCRGAKRTRRLRSTLSNTCLLAMGLSYSMHLPGRNITPSWLRNSTPCELSLCAFAIIIVF